jgi:hypothetical protein
VLHKTREERNILHAIKGRKANWIGHRLHWDCLLKRVIEGKAEEEEDCITLRKREDNVK